MSVQGKVWGETRCIFHTDTVAVYHLKIKDGGFCSEHIHKHKSNLFYVLSGKLKVTLFSGAGKDITVLGPGDSSAVPPGLYHKFEALEDCECLEFYRTYLQEPDIDRRTLGGIRK